MKEIEDDLRLTSGRVGKRALSQDVVAAMVNVPRHEFVPEHLKRYAYENRPLPIGYGQTISQPYIVGIMTDLVDPAKESVVLEVGTGSGYQAAVLAYIVKQVYSIEIIEELGEEAKTRLKRLGVKMLRFVLVTATTGGRNMPRLMRSLLPPRPALFHLP